MIHEYWTNSTPNVHPSIYPKLIHLWHLGPRNYKKYLTGWGFTHGECEKILNKIKEWEKAQGGSNLHPNEY